MLLAEIIYYGGIVIVVFLMLILVLSIGCTIVGNSAERKNPEKRIQSDNETLYADDVLDYGRKRQRLQQQMQWQQEVDRISQEAVQQAQDDAHTAMTVAERDYATAMDMFQIGNSMHEDAHSMASSAHDSFNDSFSVPSFDCGGSFGGNPFF